MILVLTVALLVAVLAFVGYPLLRAPGPAHDDRVAPAVGQRAQLAAEREHAIAALKDLEFEHSIGNLSDDDYESLRAAQRHKAVAILSELDRLDEPAPAAVAEAPLCTDHLALDARLEEEIARARQRLEAGRQRGADGAAPGVPCPSCGTLHHPSARYCSVCGRDFGEARGNAMATVTCPTCGARRAARDRFCADCGTTLDVEARDENS